ncbi:gag-pol polyprotein [Gossypium australe]|uniref:Gag-pol polyprotein n=1 Tax=Gossypium australe TaxID=47621 RepID=A0A5B6X7U5_9ROSI|nr:gag-pol polyprotein [Gossypium australe]
MNQSLQHLVIIADALQRVVQTATAITSTSTTRRAPIKKLRKYDATEFLGLKGVNPSAAENWIESAKRILKQLECTPRESLICSVSLLKEETYVWWESVTRHVPEEQVNWDFFQREFQKKYIGELYIEDKKQDFLMLKQGEMSVT